MSSFKNPVREDQVKTHRGQRRLEAPRTCERRPRTRHTANDDDIVYKCGCKLRPISDEGLLKGSKCTNTYRRVMSLSHYS